MEYKEEYSFGDIDDFEIEILRIIYMWKRYKGTRTKEGKTFTTLELSNLKSRIEDYLKFQDRFDFDKGIVPRCEECEEILPKEPLRSGYCDNGVCGTR